MRGTQQPRVFRGEIPSSLLDAREIEMPHARHLGCEHHMANGDLCVNAPIGKQNNLQTCYVHWTNASGTRATGGRHVQEN
jgi:hypothetical protein